MICALVLAAGRSERMGTQKLLLPLGGKPVIVRIVEELSRSQIDEIFVIVGKDGAQLQGTLSGQRVQFVKNPAVESDMLGSIRCGLRALPKDCEAALLVLGDQPGITQPLVDELTLSFRSGQSKIVVPTCNGHRGHPVLFSSRYFDEVLTMRQGHGLRGFLDAHVNEISSVAVADVTAMEDMDTPADYQRQEQLFASRYADTVSPP